MSKFFVGCIAFVLILPCAGAGFIWEIVCDLFQYGRDKAVIALDGAAGVKKEKA